MNILIAEDDLTSRSMLAAVLKKAGNNDIVSACATMNHHHMFRFNVCFGV